MASPEIVAPFSLSIGEGPLYDQRNNSVYWIDIPTGRILRYQIKNGNSEIVLSIDRKIGGITIQSDGTLLLFLDAGGITKWDPENDCLTTVVDSIPQETHTRFNDVIAGPRGRVFAGTVGTDTAGGNLYRIESSGDYICLSDSEYTISNGMGFSDDGDFYFIDSGPGIVYRFSYNRMTGELSNREHFIDFSAEPGIPDGMTVDSLGHLWIAHWDGGRVTKHHPETGKEVKSIEFPIDRPSSVIFGDESYTDLFVTSARDRSKPDQHEAAGALFCVPNIGKGKPENYSKVLVDN